MWVFFFFWVTQQNCLPLKYAIANSKILFCIDSLVAGCFKVHAFKIMFLCVVSQENSIMLYTVVQWLSLELKKKSKQALSRFLSTFGSMCVMLITSDPQFFKINNNNCAYTSAFTMKNYGAKHSKDFFKRKSLLYINCSL